MTRRRIFGAAVLVVLAAIIGYLAGGVIGDILYGEGD